MKEKLRLLIMDDGHDITHVLEMTLNDSHDVDAYTNPVEALANVKPHKYDDLMPKTNGFEF